MHDFLRTLGKLFLMIVITYSLFWVLACLASWLAPYIL